MQIDTDTLRAALEGAVKPLEWRIEPRNGWKQGICIAIQSQAVIRREFQNVWSYRGINYTLGLGDAQAAAQRDYDSESIYAIDLDTLAAKLGGGE
jgi:hypothetical protein